MRTTTSLIATALMVASQGPAARAADPHPCTRLPDDRERLSCYDQAYGTPAEPKPLPEPARAEQPPDKFSATVTQIEWRNGMFVVTLDNGQVWSQSERDSRVQIDAGDTVNFRRASLGSWLVSGEQGIAARVRRVR